MRYTPRLAFTGIGILRTRLARRLMQQRNTQTYKIMRKDEYIKRLYNDYIMKTQGCAPTACGFCVIAAFVIVLCSCATKTKVEYVDRNVYKTEIQTKHDTLINNVHDSVDGIFVEDNRPSRICIFSNHAVDTR